MRSCIPLLLSGLLVSGCVETGADLVLGDRAVVTGTGEEEFLNLRAGPGLGFRVILGLPDGTALTRRGCVVELGQEWCEVALADAAQISGYVAADYLASP